MNQSVCFLSTGITSLLGHGVYTAAYPLHDVSSPRATTLILMMLTVNRVFSHAGPGKVLLLRQRINSLTLKLVYCT